MPKPEEKQLDFGGQFTISDKDRKALHDTFPIAAQRERAIQYMLEGMTADQARQALLKEDADDTFTRMK